MSERNTKITQAEMAELFGERIPVAAAMLLFSDKPTEEIRAELREMARGREPANSPETIIHMAVEDALRREINEPIATKVVEALAADGFRVIGPGQLDERTIRRAAMEGYRVCAETRHVRLGGKVEAAIRALIPGQEADDGE